MVRYSGGVLAIVLAAGVLWWLLAEEPEPTYVPGGESTLGALEGEVGLAGTTRPQEVSQGDGPDSFESVSDPKALLPFLGNHATSEEAGRRLRVLLGDNAERIRAFLRSLHPDAGTTDATNHWVRRAVTQVLVASGETALDVLLSELDDGNATYRTYMDAFIGGFGRVAERAVPRLLQQLAAVPEAPPAGEAASVINALGAIGPAARAVLPDLYRWLEEGVTQDVEVAAAGAMVRIGGPNKGTWDCCRDLLREVNWPAQQRAALVALAELGPEAAPIIPILLDCAAEGTLGEGSVVLALKRIGIADKFVIDYLTLRFREAKSDQGAVGLYGQTLVSLGERYLELVLRLVGERGVMARAHLPSLFAGRKSLPWELILREMEPAFSAKDVSARRKAYQQLWNEEGLPEAVRRQYVLRGLGDGDAELRSEAADAAGELQSIPNELAAVLLTRVELEGEELYTASSCLNALAKHPRWNNDRLFRAALELRKRHPHHWQSLGSLHHFAAAHPKEVLQLWAEAVTRGHRMWRHSIHLLKQIPANVLADYPEAERALAAFHAAQTPRVRAPGMLPR